MQLNKLSVVGIVVLLILLVSVRLFQEGLFYDPLLAFFKKEGKVLPEYDAAKLFLGLTFRYYINTVLSLGIIYLFFKDAGIIKIAAALFIILFVFLIGAFFLVLNAQTPNLMVLFYIRRFLLQPLFLLLFVPAFYYQRKMK